jgi:hypothetical protein
MQATNIECYAKLQKASVFAFIVLLGSGTAMVLIATIVHNVYFWSYGTVIAGMSGIFVTLGLIAKDKLKQK